MRASRFRAPLPTAPSFLRFPFLTAGDKLAIARAMVPLTMTVQKDTGESFENWLHQHRQTPGAIERFWKPILISALSEDLNRVSISSAAQVVRESMKSPEARIMGVPTIPLTALYNAAGDYIQARGGKLQFRRPIETFQAESSRVGLRVGDTEEVFSYLILALPFEGLDRVLPETPEAARLRGLLSNFESSPITGIHLWFDRQTSDLAHALLLDRTIQWMFHKSRIQPIRSQSGNGTGTDAGGSYVELVVSSSKNLIEQSRQEIVDLALRELREFFPAAREATLVNSPEITEVHAT